MWKLNKSFKKDDPEPEPLRSDITDTERAEVCADSI